MAEKATGQAALCSQSLSTFCSSSLKYQSAIFSAHSLAKTMFFLPLSFLRLVCSFHYAQPPFQLVLLASKHGTIIPLFSQKGKRHSIL